VKWVALTVASLVVLALGVLAYHRTLPSCRQVVGYQTGTTAGGGGAGAFTVTGAGAFQPDGQSDDLAMPVYRRVDGGFFNCH